MSTMKHINFLTQPVSHVPIATDAPAHNTPGRGSRFPKEFEASPTGKYQALLACQPLLHPAYRTSITPPTSDDSDSDDIGTTQHSTMA
ncbi:hypothetical protein G7Y89_g214 [Cudoniella acicularis]|uniref:Uncharacterized protein n=1 Tax=Cudoniella acicularis TaxID=354080 RepID=A0A8H4WAL9_9HELO|nr:hypothetical protein G7Y89_g214 [Cudoniella acicularis]